MKKTEVEKCLSGEWYDCHAPEFLEFKRRAQELLMRYNALPYDAKDAKREILHELLGGVSEQVSIGYSFICDYGRNIYIGNNVSINIGCTFVDCNRITIGSDVLVAPNVQIYTATHPVDFEERLPVTECGRGRNTFALPVSIGNGCWIGGGATILPGVTIGRGSVIGAGSVVTRPIPSNCLAVGNPCRVVRRINNPKFKLVAFDLDGTIGDTLPLCISAFRKSVSPFACHELSEEEVVHTFGLNEEGMVRAIVDEPMVEQAIEAFLAEYEVQHSCCPLPFEGVRELIAGLREKGIPVALVTGKGKRSCAISLRRFCMENDFDCILTGGADKNVKAENLQRLMSRYNLKPGELLYVGDTVSDIAECEKAGVACLSAAWASKTEDVGELERLNPMRVFRSVADAAAWMENCRLSSL